MFEGDAGAKGPWGRGQVEVLQRELMRGSGRNLVVWEPGGFDDGAREDQGVDLLEYLRIFQKHKWVILGAIAVALAIGLAATLLMRPVYTAGTTLKIDREAARVVDVQDVEPREQVGDSEEFFQTQYGLLKSRSLAERVSDALGLSTSDAFLKQMGIKTHTRGIQSASDVRQLREHVLQALERNLGVSPVRGSRLVKVTFDSPSPDLSARVANSFADNFIASNLDRRFEASSYARQFLEQHLAEVKSKLEDSERQLVAYATQQQIIQMSDPAKGADPGESQSVVQADLQALNSSLAAATASRIAAEDKWKAAAAAPGLGVPEILASPTIQELSQQSAKLQAEYQNNLKEYKPDFPDMRQLKAQIDETNNQIKLEADTIRTSLKTGYESSLKQQAALQAQVDRLKSSVLDLRNRSIQYNILQREVDTNRTLYDGLLQRYKEIGVAGGVTTNNVSVVDRAEPPDRPSKPRPLLNLALAGVTGLGAGVGLTLLLELLDQAIRKPADVESKLGLPVLGSVPLLTKGVRPMEALGDARSPFSEAYYSIRSALQFSTEHGAPKVLLVTSSKPQEGKSTTSVALAQGFARLGVRTVLMDMDLRNPSLHKMVGADNRTGVSNVLTGAETLANVVQATNIPTLWVVPGGPLPPSPAELFAGPKLRDLIGQASREFEVVILDGPPVMGLADAPLIAAASEATLLVIEAGSISRAQAKGAVRRLQMANAHIIGAVLTKFDARQAAYGYGYAYEYDYRYGASETSGSSDLTKAVETTSSRRRTPAA